MPSAFVGVEDAVGDDDVIDRGRVVLQSERLLGTDGGGSERSRGTG